MKTIRLSGHVQEQLPRRGVTEDEIVAAIRGAAVSYTHLRAHETVLDLVCRLLLEKKKKTHTYIERHMIY